MPAQRYDDSPKSTSGLTLRPSRRRSASLHPSLQPSSIHPSPLPQLNLPCPLSPTSLPSSIQLPSPPIPNPPHYPPQSLRYHRTHPTSIATQRHLQTFLRTSPTTSLWVPSLPPKRFPSSGLTHEITIVRGQGHQGAYVEDGSIYVPA